MKTTQTHEPESGPAEPGRRPVEQAGRRWWPRPLFRLAVAVLGLLILAWAATSVLLPPSIVGEETAEPLLYEVSEGTIGHSIELNVVGEWEPRTLIALAAGGTITQINMTSGEFADVGDVLVHVDEQPIIALEGEVPAFRDLRGGAQGSDVRQLQYFLAEEGRLSTAPDGEFGATTQAAVRDWQRSLGVTVTGVVARGSVVFVPSLPARIALREDASVGEILGGSSPLFEVLPDSPRFFMPMSAEQLGLVETGMRVVIDPHGAAWEATLGRGVEVEVGRLEFALEAADGDQPICRDACDLVSSAGGGTQFVSEVHVVPATAGLVVPLSAIWTDASGSLMVELDDGSVAGVAVIATARGLAIVEGLQAGQEVVVRPMRSREPRTDDA